MTGRMTVAQLEKIRKRAEEATEGPWEVEENYDSHTRYIRIGSYAVIADLIEYDGDAEFIAHAREDIPALLAEVHALSESLMKANESIRDFAEREREIGAEVERLRKALIEIADIDDWDYGLELAKDITFKTIGEPKGWDGIDELLGEYYEDIAKEAEELANDSE